MVVRGHFSGSTLPYMPYISTVNATTIYFPN